MKMKIKISRPLRHTFCSNPHSYLLASLPMCITSKAYKFVAIHFKQQRKHTSLLTSMFQHYLSSNKYWCPLSSRTFPPWGIFCAKLHFSLNICRSTLLPWTPNVEFQNKLFSEGKKSSGVSPVLETNTRLDGTKRENREGTNKRKKKSKHSSLLFKQTKWFKLICLAACRACHRGGDDGWYFTCGINI